MYFGEVGDNVYQYYNVPRNIFDLFIEANNNSESIGTLKSTLLIRGGYEWVRL